MSLHDDYARRTPYELLFADRDGAGDLLARIDEEATARGVDPTDLGQFVTLGAVAAFVSGLEGPEAPPGAAHRLGALTYHSVSFERAGRPLYALTTHAARYLVEGAPPGHPAPPEAAGYVQLPQHLFWAESGGDAPGSVDGLFWSATPRGLLHVMLVAGMRPDRPGLDAVPLPEAPLADAGRWLEAEVRGEGSDFAGALPGGELDGLYAFQAAGEVLKLLGRFFAYVGTAPGALEPGEPEPGGSGPPPSTLRFTRVTLDG